MPIPIPASSDPAVQVLVSQHNELVKKLADASSAVHYEKQTDPAVATGTTRRPSQTALTISLANATDEATAVALVNECVRVFNIHCASGFPGPHATADAENPEDTAVATNSATAITRANALKASFTAHLTESGVHETNDSTTAIAADDATDAASLNTLVNELKADINSHMALVYDADVQTLEQKSL